MNYISKEERIFEDDIDIHDLKNDEMFKINLPDSKEGYDKGNGEGVWATASEKGFKIWSNDDSYKELFLVRILNDSIYYKGLSYGDYVLVESRRDCRPVAVLTELESRFGKTNWRQFVNR